MYLLKYVTVIALSALLLAGCSEDPSSLGADLVGNNLKLLKLDSQEAEYPQQSASFKKTVALGTATRLLLGKTFNLESKVAMKFGLSLLEDFANDVDAGNITIESAKLTLFDVYTFTEDTSSTFLNTSISANEITGIWNPFTVTRDNEPPHESVNLVTSYGRSGDSLYTFDIDTELVKQWVQSLIDTATYKNYGIMLTPEGETNKIVGFQGFSTISERSPFLEVHFVNEAEGIDTVVTFDSESDAHIVNGDIPPLADDEFAVQSGLVTQAKLKFDIIDFPREAVINSARLVLTGVPEKNVIGHNAFNNLGANYIISAGGMTEVDTVSSLTFSIQPDTVNTNMYSGDITRIMNQWLLVGNQGLLLHTGSQTEGAEYLVFKGSNAIPEERPRLEIIYTIQE